MEPYLLKRSDRKTIALEVDREGRLIVRAPQRASTAQIESFVREKENWIRQARERQRLRRQQFWEPSAEEKERLIQQAREKLEKRLRFYEEKMGLFSTGMKITSARTRLGSCSGKNSICFSFYLMLYPPKVIDYVVVHELAHIRYKNHGREFYSLIERYLPDYKERINLAKQGYLPKTDLL